MRKILLAIMVLFAIGMAEHAQAQDSCLLGGDSSQGFDFIYYLPEAGYWIYNPGPYSCNDCIGGTAWAMNYGGQGGCMSVADQLAGYGWLCQSTTGYWANEIEPNSSSYRAAYLLNLFMSPAYLPPSDGECFGNIGQYLLNPS